MKKKKYLYASLIFFISGIAFLFYSLQRVGVFAGNKILLRALSCTECAEYEIVMGDSKIASQLLGPSDSVNIYQAYVTGEPNPFAADFTKTYDYYLVTGKVTGLQKAKNSQMVYPVITIYKWEHINMKFEWVAILLCLVLVYISLRYFKNFRIANRPDATEVVLKTHSDPPVRKS